jgi:alpha-beta hydrolase superfamily lysophospholipase
MRATTHGVQVLNYHVAAVADGAPLSIRQWIPSPEVRTKAAIQLTHGISEHSGRYDRFAHFLAERGYRIYANDLRGHGLSVPRLTCELNSFSQNLYCPSWPSPSRLL